MQVLLSDNIIIQNPKRFAVLFIIMLLIATSISIFLPQIDMPVKYYVIILLATLLIVLSLNYKAVLTILIISLFINLNFFYFGLSEIIVVFTVLSFFITHTLKVEEFSNPMIPVFLVFFFSILPSYYNLLNTPGALPLSLHLVFFFLVYYIISLSISNYNQINYLLSVFLLISFINGFFVILSAIITGHRVFGFAGIMYVDYVGYSIIITFLYYLLKRNRKPLNLILFLIFILALIFTQTRSIWLVTGFTLLLIFIHLIINNKKYLLTRVKAIIAFATILLVVLIFVTSIKESKKDYFERIEVKKIEQTDDPTRQTLQINSLVTRYFIWSISMEAFKSSPIIGIGIYGFPFVSKDYSNLDPYLYDVFVKKLTPHETFLAILTESGIIGLLGFLIFLFYTIFFAFKSYRKSTSENENLYSLVILWLSIYTFFSMIITDAWLWGNGIILWGILLGLSAANRKIISLNHSLRI